nr:TlpA disulfide reductase family protein [Thiomicrorhabdus cannonii]
MAPVASAAPQKAASHRSTELQPYQGPQDRVLQLQDQQGNTVALSDYRGKVVLLNFWASWCPPCVHEMPSMARLKTRLKEAPFEILAVNLAESAAAISAFLQTHPVNFPVLLDPSGSAVKEWQVFAYPSTYLIDKQGQIRYALFGGTQWDAAEHLTLIEEALQQP